MGHDRWTAVDGYIDWKVVGADPVLDDVLKASTDAGLPPIAVSPSQGKFLFILAKAIGATRVLELGTLGGYSGIWLARALPPDGQLVTIDVDPTHAEVARRNFIRAGVDGVVNQRVGPALDVLQQLEAKRAGPFDLVFIDANKDQYAEYLDWAIRLSRPGALIVADNVVREGAVIDAESEDTAVRGVRRFIDRLATDPHVTGTVIQTVGVKGYDGLAVLVVGEGAATPADFTRRDMTIVSGGQTGVDRAAWDVAIELGLRIGGWVPKGRLAEDGRIPDRYANVREAASAEYPVRTTLNVRDSDATLILSRGPLTGGSLFTHREAVRLGRPVLHIDLLTMAAADAVAGVRDWIVSVSPAQLNVAGPRASGDPAVGALAADVLRQALRP